MSQTPNHNPLREGTLEEALEQTMNEEEFERVKTILGRTPNVTELAIFAVMWSEHCSYKNSILEIKKLPRSGGRLLADAGAENAGLVDIGDNWAVAFKIESHNHPSAVEPFQGAATGVGGILRDVFTMGARPIASLDSLHFGPLNDAHNRFLLDGVVKGIGHYGNCFGVPTVAGEMHFDPLYSGNPLINAMAVGVVKHDKVATAKASGVGNPVFYVGSRTGRDGTHGATFASDQLSNDNESKRSAVQVGDPFAEKLLLEATLELTGTEPLVAIQDMGAAGLTCSTSEMASAGGVGMSIDLDKVPLRETEMDPWEIMLSESQERMLLVGKLGHEAKIHEVFERWELEAVEIGVVTDDGRIKLTHKGVQVADIPAWDLVLGGGAPQYVRESKAPTSIEHKTSFDPLKLPEPADAGATLLRLLRHLEIASKSWVYEQYDQSVRTNTAVEPGRGDAAVIRVEGTTKALAVKTDTNSRYVRLNPKVGAARIVAEAARNVACVGARPVAITNCLNFGNPYKPEVFHYFREAVAGMGEACRKFETPVTGGNVSFHNETNGTPIAPTPVVGMLGLLENAEDKISGGFKQTGDAIYLLGSAPSHGLGGSAYLSIVHDRIAGQIDPVDYDHERRLVNLLVEAAQKQLISSAHDVSDGGLAVCLAECCLMNKPDAIGATVNFGAENSMAGHLFGEYPGRVIVSMPLDQADEFEPLAESHGVPCTWLGDVGGDRFIWRDVLDVSLAEILDVSLAEISEAYFGSLERIMGL